MKIAYFNCFSGAAGDMIVGACLDAGLPEPLLREGLARLGLDEVEIKIDKVSKNGISATSFLPVIKKIDDHSHKHNHNHRNLTTITEIINHAGLSENVTTRSLDIFRRLAQAEAKVHGTTVDQIHFHEVGAADAIVDIVGACLALEALEVEKIYCSPLTLGGGTVHCEHGILPVPAPATAELIRGIETASSEAKVELLTPTGAAILTSLAESFGAMPAMRITNIGYGAGQRDIPDTANVLSLMIGETQQSIRGVEMDEVCVLEADIDDATAELIGHVTELLLREGALDVSCAAVAMKKNRPGTRITVLCPPCKTTKMEQLMFRESTTFGIRRYISQRSILPRDYLTVDTVYGKIRIKRGYLDEEAVTCSVEFSDCLQAAQKHKIPVKQVISAAMTAYHSDHK